MKVLYFTRDYTPHDHRFLSALAETDHEVYFLRLEHRNSRLENRPLPRNIKAITWKGGQKPFRWVDAAALLADLKRVLSSIRPDVVHAGPIQTCAWLAARAGFHPLVSMSWGSDLLRDADQNARWRRITQYTLRRTDILVGDCRAVQEKAGEFGFSPERTVLFPWGIDLKQFSPGLGEQIRQQLGWQDCLVLLSLRSWEPVYGVDVIARGFVEAARRNPRLRLILLGAGSQGKLIRSIIEEGGVADRVFFGGAVAYPDLPAYYRAADIYLSASHSDGSSVSLMEAMACARPVIVSDIPGNREWVKPGENGWSFPDGNTSALAERILEAGQHPQLCQAFGQANRVQAERRADWPKNFQKLLEAYDKAVADTAAESDQTLQLSDRFHSTGKDRKN